MANIPLWGTDYTRQVAKTPRIAVKNRFFEKNPVLSQEPASLIARPAMKKAFEIGTGPVRKIYSSPGSFGGDLFVLSGLRLYRVSSFNFTVTDIGQISSNPVGDVSICAVAPIGTVPGYLYIAEGGVLWVYTDNGHASGRLEATGTIANGDVVRIDGTYYQFTTGAVDTGTPAGTDGAPWLVARGATNTTALQNLFNAILATGIAGTDYSTATTVHPTVVAFAFTSSELFVQAKDPGLLGNAIVTTETGAGMAWSAGTLTGGGTNQLRQVMVPDDNGAISIAHINSYVIVVPVQGADIKGRFYWIKPGENTIDPLDFATAERNPDGVHQVVVFGDKFWLLGENTTEPWLNTGDPVAPMQRFSGILFDRGSWEGTAVQVKDSLIVVDEDGAVFQIAGGLKRISRPDVEERIRRAIMASTL